MGLPAAASRRHLLSLPALGLVAGVVLICALGAAVALLLAPAVALALVLAHGITPGHALIERWRARRSVAPRCRGRSLPQRRLLLVVRRVGHLLAAALAMRDRNASVT
jgi:hypothetical protein